MQLNKNLLKRGVASASVIGLGLASQAASAAGTDVSAVTSAITDAGSPVAAIGGAVLVLMVGIKVFKWIRAAL